MLHKNGSGMECTHATVKREIFLLLKYLLMYSINIYIYIYKISLWNFNDNDVNF